MDPHLAAALGAHNAADQSQVHSVPQVLALSDAPAPGASQCQGHSSSWALRHDARDELCRARPCCMQQLALPCSRLATGSSLGLQVDALLRRKVYEQEHLDEPQAQQEGCSAQRPMRGEAQSLQGHQQQAMLGSLLLCSALKASCCVGCDSLQVSMCRTGHWWTRQV